MENIATLENHIQTKGLPLPSNYTLSMDLNLTANGEILTDYYFVDHDQRVVFFLDSVEARIHLPVWSEVQGVKSLMHIRKYGLPCIGNDSLLITGFLGTGHEMEAQYWWGSFQCH